MTAIVRLGNGKEVVISSDLGQIRLSIWANRGSLGLTLPEQEAMNVAGAIIAAVRKQRKGL